MAKKQEEQVREIEDKELDKVSGGLGGVGGYLVREGERGDGSRFDEPALGFDEPALGVKS
jgi:hypothetical protein